MEEDLKMTVDKSDLSQSDTSANASSDENKAKSSKRRVKKKSVTRGSCLIFRVGACYSLNLDVLCESFCEFVFTFLRDGSSANCGTIFRWKAELLSQL